MLTRSFSAEQLLESLLRAEAHSLELPEEASQTEQLLQAVGSSLATPGREPCPLRQRLVYSGGFLNSLASPFFLSKYWTPPPQRAPSGGMGRSRPTVGDDLDHTLSYSLAQHF